MDCGGDSDDFMKPERLLEAPWGVPVVLELVLGLSVVRGTSRASLQCLTASPEH